MLPAFQKNLFTKLIGLIALPVLDKLYMSFEPHLKNGGVLLGVQGVVVKSHGKSQAAAFSTAIESAYQLAKHSLLDKITDKLEQEVI